MCLCLLTAGEHVVGRRDALEAVLVPRVHVRVKLPCELTVGPADLVERGRRRQAEDAIAGGFGEDHQRLRGCTCPYSEKRANPSDAV